MKKIPWDKYETALLIEKYLQVTNKEIKRVEAVKTLSEELRKRAVDLGLEIDEIFRNLNGIKCRLLEIEYIFTNGEKGLSHTSKMFRDICDLFFSNNDKFMDLLFFSKAILVYPEGYKKEYQKMISLLDRRPSGNEFAIESFLEKVFS